MSRLFPAGIDLNNTQLLNALLQSLASDPSNLAGKLYYHSGTGTLRFMDGTNVRILGRLDQISAPSAAVSLNGQKLTSVADGTAAGDAVNKGQMDAAILGLDLREEVRAAALSNGTLASAYANGSTVDGVTLATGDRILLAGQSAGAENGVYTVNASGAPTRATDFDTASDAERGVLIPVVEGTSNKGLYLHTTAGTITLGTTALVFFRINPPSGSSLAKYSQTYGGNANQTITHNLNTTDVQVQVRETATNNVIEPDIIITDANTVNLVEATAPGASSRRVVVIG